ncbi:hypothetical protein TYRP_009655 [Tyrophagus putrescentiae]|nr:hypothetical protein TYRP_009655 [Tyrophagus putrescentiae]
MRCDAPCLIASSVSTLASTSNQSQTSHVLAFGTSLLDRSSESSLRLAFKETDRQGRQGRQGRQQQQKLKLRIK